MGWLSDFISDPISYAQESVEESTGTDLYGQGEYVISQLDPMVQTMNSTNEIAGALGLDQPYSEGQIGSYTDTMNALGALTALYYGGSYALGGSGEGAAATETVAGSSSSTAVAEPITSLSLGGGGGGAAATETAGAGMSTADWVGLGAQAVGSAASYQSAQDAAAAAAAGQAQAAQLTSEQLIEQRRQYEQLLALGAPYREVGLAGLGRYMQYTQDPSAMYQDPTYQAMLAQGTKAVEGSAAARGTQLSGRTMADLQQLGMSTASQYRSQIMGELAILANIGSTTLGQSYGVGGQAMAQTAGAYSNLATLAQQTGQIQAGAAMGQGTAISNLAGTLGAAYIKNQ